MKKQQSKKPTTDERIAEGTKLTHAHLGSATVASEMRMLAFEDEELSRREAGLTSALAEVRGRRKAVAASLSGLRAVLAAR